MQQLGMINPNISGHITLRLHVRLRALGAHTCIHAYRPQICTDAQMPVRVRAAHRGHRNRAPRRLVHCTV